MPVTIFLPPEGVSSRGLGLPTPWNSGVPSARNRRVGLGCNPIKTVSALRAIGCDTRYWPDGEYRCRPFWHRHVRRGHEHSPMISSRVDLECLMTLAQEDGQAERLQRWF